MLNKLSLCCHPWQSVGAILWGINFVHATIPGKCWGTVEWNVWGIYCLHCTIRCKWEGGGGGRKESWNGGGFKKKRVGKNFVPFSPSFERGGGGGDS